ncbi:MAG: prepilin-type N-terminal cleavage/methylation domain-containing protein [Rhodospirillaceae bacterium]
MTTVARPQSAQDTLPRQGERGFTLIELSIVLVIIGLLIGGILQGQEMINNTRLKTTVAQIDATTAAVQTFQDKYRAFPGDYEFANTRIAATLTQGNGDGVVGDQADADPIAFAAANGDEMVEVWAHLGAANLMTGFTSDDPPEYAAKITAGQFDLGTFAFTTGGNSIGMRLRNVSGEANPVLLPADAATMDERYDNGLPNTGRWQAAGADCIEGNAADDTYTFLGEAVSCVLVISIR